jgi:hypothetical protein
MIDSRLKAAIGEHRFRLISHKFPERLPGLHLHLAAPLDMFKGVSILREDCAADEQAMLAHSESFVARESGYVGVHTTKPQSLAFGLNDSPIGLLAWILEKRRTWSDCNGAVETKFSKDEILDTVMIFWVTQSIALLLRGCAQSLGSRARRYPPCRYTDSIRTHAWMEEP